MRTLANIQQAVCRGISVRFALVDVYDGQDTETAAAELAAPGALSLASSLGGWGTAAARGRQR